MAYCEGRELGVFSLCLMGWRTQTLLAVGRWDEATEVCAQMLGHRGISPVNQINPLQVLGTIRGRRGEDGAWELLDRALAMAEGTGDPLWIAPVRAVRAELRWLSGDPGLAASEVRSGYDRAAGCAEPWTFGSLLIWFSRLGMPVPAELPAGLPEPYALEMAGDWRRGGGGLAAARPALRRRAGPARLGRRGRAPAGPGDLRRRSAPGPPPPRPGGR